MQGSHGSSLGVCATNYEKTDHSLFLAQNAKVCSEIFNPTIQPRMDPEQYQSLKKAKALSPKQIEKQELPGPFSYLGYLKHQLKPGSWGDEIIVTAMSMM